MFSIFYLQIDSDFAQKFPAQKDCLVKQWATWREKMFKVCTKLVTNQVIKDDLKNFPTATQNDQDFLLIKSLISIFYTGKLFNSSERKKKFTIIDSITNFIIEAECKREAFELTQKIISDAHVLGMDEFPIIAKVGNNFIVLLNEICYSTDNFVVAIDIVFKLFYTFDLQFPRSIFSFYTFLQVFFYGLRFAGKLDTNLSIVLQGLNEK